MPRVANMVKEYMIKKARAPEQNYQVLVSALFFNNQ